jgi:transposase
MAAQPRPPASIPQTIKRQGPRVRLPSITDAALRAALTTETRPRIRRRLLALQAVRSGASRREAAQIARVGLGSIKNWLRIVQRSGWERLTLTPVRRKPFGTAARKQALREIEVALITRLDAQSRTRIIAVREVLLGQSIYKASRSAAVNPATVTQWLARARRFGVADLIPRPKKAPPSAKLQGRRRSAFSPGRRIRLNPAQLWELSDLLKERPAISWSDLLAAVKQRFGVIYSKSGITRVVQEELGYRRVGRRLLRETRRGLRRFLCRNRG